MAWKEQTAELRRLSSLLMAGNGTALLVIFNAIAQGHVPAQSSLRPMAWCFAVGLVAAFGMAYFFFVRDSHESAPLGVLETETIRAKEKDRVIGWLTGAFLVSAIAFVVGLVSAVEMVGPSNQTAPTSASLSAVSSALSTSSSTH